MNILMLAPEFIPARGGVGIYITELIRHLPNDYNIIAITPNRGHQDYKSLHPNLKVIQTAKATDTFVYNAKFQYMCSQIVPKIMQSKHIDVIHSHTAHMPDILLNTDMCNVVTTIHGTIQLQRYGSKQGTHKELSEHMTGLLYPGLRLIEKYYFSKNRKYITVSNWMAQHMKSNYGIDCAVIHNAVDTDFWYKRDKFEYISKPKYNNRKIVLYTGRLIALKGIDTIINTMPFVIAKHPDVLFIFVGNTYNKEYKNILDKSNIPEYHYEFTGHITQNELVELYSIANCFVLPSYFENLPTSLLESMSCECPSIVSGVGGIPEVINNRKNGILLNQNKAHELAYFISTVLDNPDKCAKMGHNSRATIEDKFSWKKNIDKIVGVYESC